MEPRISHTCLNIENKTRISNTRWLVFETFNKLLELRSSLEGDMGNGAYPEFEVVFHRQAKVMRCCFVAYHLQD